MWYGYECEGLRTPCWGQLSSSTIWVGPRVWTQPSGLEASIFTCWAVLLAQTDHFVYRTWLLASLQCHRHWVEAHLSLAFAEHVFFSKGRYVYRDCGYGLPVLGEGLLELGVAAQSFRVTQVAKLGLFSELTLKFTWWPWGLPERRSAGMGKKPRVCSWWEMTCSVFWFSTDKMSRLLFKCTVVL